MSAPAVAFVAGVTTSFGPCVAPRYVAIAGLTAGLPSTERFRRIAMFVGGICLSYIALGSIAGALGALTAYASIVYALLAIGCIVLGIRTIVEGTKPSACHDGHAAMMGSPSFVAGCCMAAVASPCCGPVAGVVAGLSIATGKPWFGALLMLAYALGHSVALIGAAVGSLRVERLLSAPGARQAVDTVAGALMLGIGGYYGLLV
jgi:cytochrome c-type biogenesis protein